MTDTNPTLPDLGWGPFYQSQLSIEEFDETTPLRICGLQRNAVETIGPDGAERLPFPSDRTALTVGDWILKDRASGQISRLLERKSLLQRMAAGSDSTAQLIAANVDTLFIVTSCNADFNIARLERYLALAHQARVDPVVILTKSDLCSDAQSYLERARSNLPNVIVEAVDATSADVIETLSPWCGTGQTVALLGSSGVGKSTLVNALSGAAQDTQGIREDDAHGRHTTTTRSMHRIVGGGWLMDTPGMRSLGIYDLQSGVDAVFEDIVELAAGCKFNDCGHDSEPGCVVQAAIAAGDLNADRLKRWQKLQREGEMHAETIAEAHARTRRRQKTYATGKARVKEKQRGLE